MEILDKCNLIYVPMTEEENSINKMQLLLHENTLHREYSGMMKRMRIISNKVTGMGGSSVLQNSGILNQIPMTAAIPSVRPCAVLRICLHQQRLCETVLHQS